MACNPTCCGPIEETVGTDAMLPGGGRDPRGDVAAGPAKGGERVGREC